MPHHEIGCLDHCPRGGGGKGWAALTLIVVVVVAILGYKVRHGIETGAEIVLAVLIGGLALTLLTVIGFIVYRMTRRGLVIRQVPPPVEYEEPAYQITQMGTHRTVRGAIEAPRVQPETDPGRWLGDTDWRQSDPAPALPRENPRSRAPRQETGDRDEARYHSRFR